MAVRVTTRASTSTSVRTTARSYVHVGNELLRCLYDIVEACGLSLDYLQDLEQELLRNIRAWLVKRQLLRLTLEIWVRRTGLLFSRNDFPIDYRTPPATEEKFDTDMDRVAKSQPAKPPPNACDYRILVWLTDDAPRYGWTAKAELRDTKHLKKRTPGTVIDTAAAGVQLEQWS